MSGCGRVPIKLFKVITGRGSDLATGPSLSIPTPEGGQLALWRIVLGGL